VCELHCAQLLHTILHRTDLIIFPLTLQTIIIAQVTISLLRWCLFEGRKTWKRRKFVTEKHINWLQGNTFVYSLLLNKMQKKHTGYTSSTPNSSVKQKNWASEIETKNYISHATLAILKVRFNDNEVRRNSAVSSSHSKTNVLQTGLLFSRPLCIAGVWLSVLVQHFFSLLAGWLADEVRRWCR